MTGPPRAPGIRRTVATAVALVAALLVCVSVVQSADPVGAGKAAADPSVALRRILNSEAISSRLSAWGLSVADVQLDVDAMTPEERARLLRALTRPWPESGGYGEADLRAQYLVTVSLMRESTLFASVLRSFR